MPAPRPALVRAPQPVPHRPARCWPAQPAAGELTLAPVPPLPTGRAGWVAALLPALGVLPVAGFALTGARHGTSLLLVLLLVPALSGSVAMVVSQRRRDRRGRRGARARWRAHCDDLLVRAAPAASAQRLALDRLHPDAAGLTAWLQAGFAFERRPGDPDALVVCVGAGEVPCRVPIVRSAGHPLQEVDAELDAQAQAAARATATLACAPVTVGLREVGVLAVVGSRPEVRPVLAAVTAQLGALHAPGELELGGSGDGGSSGAWSWAAALPHARGTPPGAGFGCDDGAVGVWLSAPSDAPMRVAVVAAYRPGSSRGLDAALAAPGVLAVVGCERRDDLPAGPGRSSTCPTRR